MFLNWKRAQDRRANWPSIVCSSGFDVECSMDGVPWSRWCNDTVIIIIAQRKNPLQNEITFVNLLIKSRDFKKCQWSHMDSILIPKEEFLLFFPYKFYILTCILMHDKFELFYSLLIFNYICLTFISIMDLLCEQAQLQWENRPFVFEEDITQKKKDKF